MLRLFYFPGACSLASHIVLEETGATYERRVVNLREGQQRTPEYLQINPKGRVPALQTDRGTLTENPAIIAYLAQSFPAAQLAPLEDPYAFGKLQEFHLYLATTVHVAFAHVSRPARYADGEAAAAAMKVKALQSLQECYAGLDQQLADRPYVHGERYTISDAYLLVFERWYARLEQGPLAQRFPHLHAHLQRVQGRPAVQRVLAAEAAS